MKKTKKTILTAGLGLGVGALAATCGVTNAMSSLALNRKLPSFARYVNISGGKPDSDFHARRDLSEKALLQMPSTTVAIRSFDGLELLGHLVKCEHPQRLIIAFHGWRSTWARDFCMVAPFWNSHNCTVLYVEQRAQGSSEGDYMTFGLLERKDCLAWANWADSQNLGLPIYLSGISMGATTVLMAAGEDLPESIKGIQADCGFTSPKAIMRHVSANNLHLPDTPARRLFTEVSFRRRLHQGLSSYSTVTAMEHCRVPVLFVHGTDDSFVPIEMTYENCRACAAPHRLVVVPGAAHGMSYVLEPETCQEAMLSFWKSYDK